ncbi:MAG: hypothetical protein AB7V39_04385 [Nitrospiraceae bacterium]
MTVVTPLRLCVTVGLLRLPIGLDVWTHNLVWMLADATSHNGMLDNSIRVTGSTGPPGAANPVVRFKEVKSSSHTADLINQDSVNEDAPDVVSGASSFCTRLG